MWRLLAIAGIVVDMAVGIAAGPVQGPELNQVMREKLIHAQRVFEAVVTSNWVTLDVESRELERLTNDPRWMALKYPEYSQHSAAFVRAVQSLRRAAAQRSLEEAPKAYVAVALQCVDCHRYLARARIAQ